MRTRFLLILVFAVSLVLAPACSTVPVTGRSQLDLVPDSQIQAMSYQQYGQFMKENRLSTNARETQMVKNVGQRIQRAVEQYFAARHMTDQLKGYQWEFNLIADDQANAFCMPGGKVVVYEGIMPVAKDETGLAVVVGHEIAHAVAKHGDERMSQALLAQLGGVALTTALKDKPSETQQIWMAAYGVGAQVGVLLPYSRLQESEADHLGLIFMAMAGYDPRQATAFWQRMEADHGGGGTPEFLSTHPVHATRIRNIQNLIPEAMKYYNPR